MAETTTEYNAAATTPHSEPKPLAAKKSRVPARLMKVFWALLAAAGGGLITFAFTEYSNRLRYLDYSAEGTTGLFPKIDLAGRQFSITLVDPTTRPATTQPISNISTIRLAVRNNTGKDYPTTHIIVRFDPLNGSPPPLISKRASEPPEIVAEEPVKNLTDGSLRLGYEIKKLNRGNELVFDYVFEGTALPVIQVKTGGGGTGLEMRLTSDKPSSGHAIDWLIVVFTGFMSITSAAMAFVIFPFRSRRMMPETAEGRLARDREIADALALERAKQAAENEEANIDRLSKKLDELEKELNKSKQGK